MKNPTTILREALALLHTLPTGIDPDGVDENDTSPEDTVFHVGSLVARKVQEAIAELEKGL